jgi:hypothetical protein
VLVVPSYVRVFIKRPAPAAFAGRVGASALLGSGEVDSANALESVRDDLGVMSLAVGAQTMGFGKDIPVNCHAVHGAAASL